MTPQATMTPDLFYEEVVEFIRRRWTVTRGPWADDNAGEIYYDFADLDPEVVQKALWMLYREGRQTPPSPSALMAQVTTEYSQLSRDMPIRGGKGSTDPCVTDGHVWAIVDEHDGLRDLVCARCRQEETRTVHQVRTSGEIEEDGRPPLRYNNDTQQHDRKDW